MLLFSFTSFASREQSILEEQTYDQFVKQLNTSASTISFVGLSPVDHKTFVDALWDQITFEDKTHLKKVITALPKSTFPIADQIRLELLQAWPKKIVLPKSFASSQLSLRAQLLILSYSDHISNFSDFEGVLPQKEKQSFAKSNIPENKEMIRDLYFNTPNVEDFRDGKYKDSVRIFMFCRKNRRYKCIIMLKDKDNKPVMREDGETHWHQPALGLSSRGYPSHKRNGHTPAGIHLINSVMPYANKQHLFGKFRRFILNWVPSSANEELTKKFLPESSHNSKWWKQASVARDVGRGLIRIHGTGRYPTNTSRPNYPLRPTAGCIMQREGIPGKNYKDQRHILDASMKALGLEAKYENEVELRGVVYLIEMDNRRKTVTYSDVKVYLGL